MVRQAYNHRKQKRLLIVNKTDEMINRLLDIDLGLGVKRHLEKNKNQIDIHKHILENNTKN